MNKNISVIEVNGTSSMVRREISGTTRKQWRGFYSQWRYNNRVEFGPGRNHNTVAALHEFAMQHGRYDY